MGVEDKFDDGVSDGVGAAVEVGDGFFSFDGFIGWSEREGDVVATEVLPVVRTGFAVHATGSFFVGLLDVAGYKEGLGLGAMEDGDADCAG